MSTAIDKPLNGARILVAEDDPVLAFDIIGQLLKAGAQIAGPALSLERTIELANAEQLTCAILDVQLRDGLVFPAARILQGKGVGIVFYTGQHDPEGLKREWPSAQVLVKPAPLDMLIRAVAAAREGARPQPDASGG
jgi:two-component system, response regulator PdtaR